MTRASAGCDFDRDYAVEQAPLLRSIEQRIRGSDHGATSWTTRAQAEAAAARLGLNAGRCLLELGAGSGWPSLFMASATGCEIVVTDLPLSGLRIAHARAVQDGLGACCSVVAADGTALPFAAGSFDRIHHADVLCCLEPKRRVLRECHRVGRDGALMEFSVIAQVRAPAGRDEEQLLRSSGPPHADAGADYAQILQQTGWAVLDRFDVTAAFVDCMQVYLEEYRRHRHALIDLLGEQDYTARLQRRVSTRAAVSRGLMKREIFLARRHGAGQIVQ